MYRNRYSCIALSAFLVNQHRSDEQSGNPSVNIVYCIDGLNLQSRRARDLVLPLYSVVGRGQVFASLFFTSVLHLEHMVI